MSGPTEVTAGMIAATGDIEVTNPDLMVLAVLAELLDRLEAQAPSFLPRS